MNEWKYLEDVCLHISDCPHSTPEWTKSGYVVLRNQNIKNGRLDLSEPSYTDEEHFKERIRRVKPKAGDIVFTREAPMGEVCLIPVGVECCLGQRQVLIRANQELIDSRFLFYSFQADAMREQIMWNEGTGTTVSNVRIPVLKKLKVSLLPLPEQKAIADVLGALDDQIEVLRATNQTLEEMAQALFQSWFVDFDPVRAKALGVALEATTPEIDALFPDELEAIGETIVPKGWRVGTIGKEVRAVGGSTPSTKEPRFWEDGVHYWATPKDFSKLQFPVLLETERLISEEGLNQISSRLLPPKTVLLSSRAPIGYLALSEVPVAINQGFIAMICDQVLSPYYVLHWTEHKMDVIKSRANGTTFMEISKSAFRPIPVIVPPKGLVKAFDDFVAPMYEQIKNNMEEMRSLAQIRGALLPKLISGDLRVSLDASDSN